MCVGTQHFAYHHDQAIRERINALIGEVSPSSGNGAGQLTWRFHQDHQKNNQGGCTYRSEMDNWSGRVSLLLSWIPSERDVWERKKSTSPSPMGVDYITLQTMKRSISSLNFLKPAKLSPKAVLKNHRKSQKNHKMENSIVLDSKWVDLHSEHIIWYPLVYFLL